MYVQFTSCVYWEVCAKFKPQELKNLDIFKINKWLGDWNWEKSFWFLAVSLFWSCTIEFRYLRLVKGAVWRKFIFSQCFGNSHFCFQIKSSDYCGGVSAKLKYLNLYDYIFNPVLSIVTLEGSHFGSSEDTPVSQQNSQTSKKIGLNISILLSSWVIHWHIVM